MLRQALFEIGGPVAIRYPRGGEGRFCEDSSSEAIAQLCEGEDITLVSYGILVNHLLEAAELLKEKGIRAEVVKLNRIAPLTGETVCRALGNRKRILVLEDSFGAGCVGQRLNAVLAENGQAPGQLILKNLGKTYAPEGSVAQLERRFGLDAAAVATAAEEAIGNG